MKATNIKWDTDGDLILFQELPKTIEIPKDVTKDQISDYLSDQTGFCHFGYELIDDEPSQDGKHTHKFSEENKDGLHWTEDERKSTGSVQ